MHSGWQFWIDRGGTFTDVVGRAPDGSIRILDRAQRAAATAFCNLKPTADGFVALRAAPAPTAKLIGRMTSRDEVLLGQGEKGDWIEVTWWRGDDRHTKGYDRKAGHGWVNRKLIGEECG